MQRGRPTQHEQREIKKNIFYYYENNVEASTASRMSGYDYKTVLRHYKIFDKEILESEKNTFLERTKIAKEKLILSLDVDILSLTKSIEKIENSIEQSLKTGNLAEYEKLYRLYLKTMEQRTKTKSAKINLIGIPIAEYMNHQEEIQNDI